MSPVRPAPGLPARAAAVLVAAAALALLPVQVAGAHPLGNFTVNRYDGLVAAPGELRVDHVEDLAEIPATQAGPDRERLGTAEWARRRCETAARDSRLTVDGRAVALTARHSHARVRPGQAGLETLRVECRLTAPLPTSATVAVTFRAAGSSSGPGWREISARGDRTTLTASDVPEASVSRELTRYPDELLSSPADIATASLRVRPGGPALDRERQDAPAASVLPRGADRWTRALDSLVARRDLTLGFAGLALALAVVLGALHALAPGHGKTLMAAAAAARGGGARLKDVLPLAASVTVTHTLGVVALGLLVTAGSAAGPSVVAWLGVAGGVLVTLAGANLLRRALRDRGRPHSHSHSHSHGDHHGEHTRPTLRGTVLLGFAGGLVPSPSAVVVLVGAAALGQAWFGLLLVVAYGAGLALTLTAAGVAVIRLGDGVRRVLNRRPRWTSSPPAALVRRATPLASACAVVAVGVGLVFRGAASALG
ncbi:MULTISPECIES: urease accessory protein UreH domain-containing protein [Streptomyces]|uniref:urease accessory protein UreH domain-containing protein n=1 Tax=Streptomyces TaxID=1883 RepID=UPI001FDC7EFA|nr:sulfite exporter TauE/SafE family protein [Streptomyces sp. CL12-4]